MKKALKVLGVMAGLIIITGAAGFFFLTRGLEEVASVQVGEIYPGQKEDGIYEGYYENYRWKNEVAVHIEDGRIVEIIVNDAQREDQEGLERKMTDAVMEAQSTQVEVVSGATVSSKAYLKAIEDALQ